MKFITLHKLSCNQFAGEISIRDDTIISIEPAKYAHWGTYVTCRIGLDEKLTQTYNVSEDKDTIKNLLLVSWCPPPKIADGNVERLPAREDWPNVSASALLEKINELVDAVNALRGSNGNHP